MYIPFCAPPYFRRLSASEPRPAYIIYYIGNFNFTIGYFIYFCKSRNFRLQ